MPKCKVCIEKQIEIDRLLIAYAKDKKLHYKVIAILIGLVVAISIGIDNSIKLWNAIKG